MDPPSNKIDSVISQNRVKLHCFKPSQRKIWTVVGLGAEYWLDPSLGFCSCPSYYFGNISGKTSCYHLESVCIAQKEKKFETIVFSDDEYQGFISGLISDLLSFRTD